RPARRGPRAWRLADADLLLLAAERLRVGAVAAVAAGPDPRPGRTRGLRKIAPPAAHHRMPRRPVGGRVWLSQRPDRFQPRAVRRGAPDDRGFAGLHRFPAADGDGGELQVDRRE